MRIAMFTNTYLPVVGGVARSVELFTQALRGRGHRVLVVAPRFKENMPGDEQDVVRLPAIQQFNGSDFAVRLPVPGFLREDVEAFDPQIIHSHHPFLLGDAAMWVAASRGLPLVFTHHTMWEQYTHYVPGDSPAMKKFVIKLVTDYCNLCDHVIAPSQSVEAILRERGVEKPITAIPTGIERDRFADGDGAAVRRRYNVPGDACVIGHVGRLATEKNLPFLARACAALLHQQPDVHALIVGDGQAKHEIESIFQEAGAADRLHMTGSLKDQELVDAYHAMDVFAFASTSETQGMVLAEALMAGVPLVAIDAPGAREVVRDGENGRLLEGEDEQAFTEALAWFVGLSPEQRENLREAARRSAEPFTLASCADKLAALYGRVLDRKPGTKRGEPNAWTRTVDLLEREWKLWSSRAEAAIESIGEAIEP